ncbi:UvrD-helicase domain-containing protein [Virgibacillus sp. JSM 102003]|uniref:UvrD-helicase domain-containing protein n=1 Tax=Virgibacillus sp. JSM 102003 TaxID=1562108 RepID=UPI0035C0AD22
MESSNREVNMNIDFQKALLGLESCVQRGKGFSVYNVSENDLNNINKMVKKAFGSDEVTYIRLSEYDSTNEVNGETPLVIYQDINRAEMLKVVDPLVNKLIYPTWFHKNTIIYISTFEKKENSVYDISSTLIHSDYNKVIKLLSLEQLENILDLININIHDFNMISLYDERVLYTPIELILRDKLIEKNIPFEPQVKLGRFYVDFLVTINGQKVIVECDGRDYHSLEKDKERDKELEVEGYRIFRFTGSELYNNVEKCIEILILNSKKFTRTRHVLEELNEEQKNATNHIDGPMRLLAPAGSGKTKTLINRIANLINSGVNPDEILALAFNKRASEEMKDRLQNLFGISNVNVRTFHSFGNQVIKEKLNWRFDSKKEKNLTRSLLESAIKNHVTLKHIRNKDPLGSYLEKLSKIKNELLPYDEFFVEDEDKVIDFKPIFDDYLAGMKNHNFHNYDDMLYLASRILLEDKFLRQSIQGQYKYILVDEFQDLNKVQLLILQILSLPENNLFIVGDDDQMIYGFRGAEIKHILEFNHRYTINTDQVLNINYRSTGSLVRHSKWLIDHNVARVYKEITPDANDKGNISFYVGQDLKKQCEEIGRWILALKNKNNKWSDFAVLYRYNEYEINLYVELSKMGIPVPFNDNKILNSSVGKCIFAYLTTIYKPDQCNNDTFKRIINIPNKYIRNSFITTINTWDDFIDLETSLNRIKEMNKERYKNFVLKIKALNQNVEKHSAYELVSSIVDGFGLIDFYNNQSSHISQVDSSSDSQIIQIILTLSAQFDTVEEFYSFWTNKQLNDGDDIPGQTDDLEEVQDLVTLNSIHKTKGNEFLHAAIFNMSRKVNERLSEDEMEEERRVAYVGVTRPKSSLLITSQAGEISHFVREYFLNPEFKEVGSHELNEFQNNIDTEINVLKSELHMYDDSITELKEKYPEMEGKRLNVDKPFIKIKEFIRKKRLEKGLAKHEVLQSERSTLLYKIELKELEQYDILNEQKYRELLNQRNKNHDEFESNNKGFAGGSWLSESTSQELNNRLESNHNINSNEINSFQKKKRIYYDEIPNDLLKVSEKSHHKYNVKAGSNSNSLGAFDEKIAKRNEELGRPVNSHLQWTREEEKLLTQRLNENVPIKEIARLHGRKESAIRARIKKLDLSD